MAGGQPGWIMLCKELFRRGMTDEAMIRVKKGYDEDRWVSPLSCLTPRGPMLILRWPPFELPNNPCSYVGDAKLNQYVIEELCKAGLKVRAIQGTPSSPNRERLTSGLAPRHRSGLSRSSPTWKPWATRRLQATTTLLSRCAEERRGEEGLANRLLPVSPLSGQGPSAAWAFPPLPSSA